MANKQITDLAQVTSLEGGDLFLTRVASAGIDNKITKADLVKTMGNPAVNGFSATSTAENRVTLASSNDANVDTYYDCMRVGFISPINSSGAVQIQIGNEEIADLSYKPLKQYNSDTTVTLTTGDYIEAVYIAAEDSFYQINATTDTIYTNDGFVVAGVVSGGETSTNYTLTTGFGINKTSYYNNMTISFVPDIDSKGAVYLNIDGLGNKQLIDNADDKIANNLKAGHLIMAYYNGTDFIKNMFTEEEEDADPLPADAINDEGEIIPENVPEDNKVSVTVGPTGKYQTVYAAISDLIKNYGADGGNRIATVNLNVDYTPSGTFWAQGSGNLSWITIQAYASSTTIIGERAWAIAATNCTLPNFSGKFILSGVGHFANFRNSVMYSKGLEIVGENNINTGNVGFIISDNSYCKFEDFSINNGPSGTQYLHYAFSVQGSKLEILGNSYIGRCNSTPINSSTSEITYNNLRLESSLSDISIILSNRDTQFNMTNCTVKNSGTGQAVRVIGTKNASLVNCTINGSSSRQSLIAEGGSDVTLDGGNYNFYNGTSSNMCVLATGAGTIVRLKGGLPNTIASASTGATITT